MENNLEFVMMTEYVFALQQSDHLGVENGATNLVLMSDTARVFVMPKMTVLVITLK